MDFTWATVAWIAGIVTVLIIFVGAWQIVQKARVGNSKLREVRQDPHAAPQHRDGDGSETHRDVPQ